MSYWLQDWMDLEGIRSRDDAKRAMRSTESTDRLLTAASQMRDVEVEWEPDQDRLFTGHIIDLTGSSDCIASRCLIERSNELIRKTWHSFDSVVVTGLDPYAVEYKLSRRDDFFQEVVIPNQIELALHLKTIGAYDVLDFVSRPTFCKNHLNQHAREVGLLQFESMERRLRRTLLDSAELVKYELDGDHLEFEIRIGLLGEVLVGRRHWPDAPPREEFLQQTIRKTGQHFAAETIGSSAFAQKIGAALGQGTTPLDDKIWLAKTKKKKISTSDAALELRLPMAEHLPVGELIAEMRRRPVELEALRSAIRNALLQQIRHAGENGAKADEVAATLYHDIVEPKLIEIERAVKSAESTGLKGDGAAALVGGTLTTIGLLAFAPIVVPGIVITASGVVASHHKWIQEMKEVRNQDLYFLWRLEKAARSH